MQTWKECAWFKCRKRFEPGRHTNQHHRIDGHRHKGALYCSRSCQQKAYRHRRNGVTVADDISVAATVTLASAPPTRPNAAPSSGGARPTFVLPADCVFSDWRLCLPVDWQSLPDLSIPPSLRVLL